MSSGVLDRKARVLSLLEKARAVEMYDLALRVEELEVRTASLRDVESKLISTHKSIERAMVSTYSDRSFDPRHIMHLSDQLNACDLQRKEQAKVLKGEEVQLELSKAEVLSKKLSSRKITGKRSQYVKNSVLEREKKEFERLSEDRLGDVRQPECLS